MSADNWTSCQRCRTVHDAALADEQQRVSALYGKVPVEQFDRARAALTQLQVGPVDKETLREDYEIGIHDGVFTVSYRGGCEKCGFEYVFNHSVNLSEPNR